MKIITVISFSILTLASAMLNAQVTMSSNTLLKVKSEALMNELLYVMANGFPRLKVADSLKELETYLPEAIPAITNTIRSSEFLHCRWYTLGNTVHLEGTYPEFVNIYRETLRAYMDGTLMPNDSQHYGAMRIGSLKGLAKKGTAEDLVLMEEFGHVKGVNRLYVPYAILHLKMRLGLPIDGSNGEEIVGIGTNRTGQVNTQMVFNISKSRFRKDSALASASAPTSTLILTPTPKTQPENTPAILSDVPINPPPTVRLGFDTYSNSFQN